MSSRVLVLSEDPVGATMGGNAIRAYEIARALGAHAGVSLLAPASGGEVAGVEHVPAGREDVRELRSQLRGVDMVLAMPRNPVIAAELRRCQARIVYDLYDPRPLQVLEAYAGSPRRRRMHSLVALDHYLAALAEGDHFICASERQRDLWIGVMLGAGLLGPELYDADPSLRALIDVVPFGIPDEPPLAEGESPREQFAQLGPEAELVIWNGGLWNWLDPVAAVAAMAEVHPQRPDARLLFMGRPPADERQARAAHSARELARRSGLLDRVVVFNEDWVPYSQRAAWLLGADCSLSLHVDHLETRFSFRTRLLDSLWAGLPIVCTEGDELSELVDHAGLGASAPAGDARAVAAAIAEVLGHGRDAYSQRLARAAEAFRWSAVIAPLVGYASGGRDRPARGRRHVGAREARALITRSGRLGLRTLRRLGSGVKRRP